MSAEAAAGIRWYRVLAPDELPEGRVKTVTAGHRSLAVTHFEGQYGAPDNRCPHQGGPLGEGSIENGLLRCPWHGWDYCPLTGKAPGFDDGVEAFEVEIRDDGVYVALPLEKAHERTVGDLMIETLVNWGIKHVFGMVGHSNLALADALRVQESEGRLRYIGIRHEGAAAFAVSAYGKLTGRPAQGRGPYRRGTGPPPRNAGGLTATLSRLGASRPVPRIRGRGSRGHRRDPDRGEALRPARREGHRRRPGRRGRLRHPGRARRRHRRGSTHLPGQHLGADHPGPRPRASAPGPPGPTTGHVDRHRGAEGPRTS